MAYPPPTDLDSRESLLEQAWFFYNQYEETKKKLEEEKKRAKELRESLFDMLNQHGENWALSSNREACALLGHPFPMPTEEDGTNKYYDVDRCFCRERRRGELKRRGTGPKNHLSGCNRGEAPTPRHHIDASDTNNRVVKSRLRAKCSCGWTGRWRENPVDAGMDAQEARIHIFMLGDKLEELGEEHNVSIEEEKQCQK